MTKAKPKTHVVMAKAVACRWITKVAKPEYRVKILLGSKEIKNLPGLLRSFRDGKVAMSGVPHVADLGVKEHFDALEVWSRNHEGLTKLAAWFEKRGFETTGVW